MNDIMKKETKRNVTTWIYLSLWHPLEVLPFPCLLFDERTDMHSLEKLVQRKLFVVVDGTTFLCARPISRSAEDNKVGKRTNFAPQPHT